jgi:hypothetical protein
MTVTVIDAQDNLELASLLFTTARACLLLKRLGTVIHGLCPQVARSGNAKRQSHSVFKAVEPLIRSISQLIVGCGVAVNRAHDLLLHELASGVSGASRAFRRKGRDSVKCSIETRA